MGFATNIKPQPRACPLCRKPLRELEHVEAKHTPASVPEHKRGWPYSITRRYVIAECENEHRVRIEGRGLFGMGVSDLQWEHHHA